MNEIGSGMPLDNSNCDFNTTTYVPYVAYFESEKLADWGMLCVVHVGWVVSELKTGLILQALCSC